MRKTKRGFGIAATGTVLSALVLAMLALPQLSGGAAHAAFTSDFRLESCTWSSRGKQNPYIKLKPGYRLLLEGEEEDDGELIDISVQITVQRQTERITFETPDGNVLTVKARVIEEREWEDGELVEVSRNWMARCVETSDVFYFGEDVDDYEDGEIVGHSGAWRAGVDGAQPGILMPGRFLLGARYFQEVAPGIAEDRAKNVEMGLEVGDFTGCVGVLETSPLDAGEESVKVYCPGVGLVIDDDVSLVEFANVRPGEE